MISQIVKVQNSMGVHARPAALIVKIASKYKSDVYISKNGREINGKSIMGVMMLAAEMGSEILFKIHGEDQEQAMAALVDLVNNKFYEE